MPQPLFAGGEIDSITVTSGAITHDSTAGRFDSAYARTSLNPGSGQFVATFISAAGAPTSVVAGETGYFHFDEFLTSNTTTVSTKLEVLDASDGAFVRVTFAASGVQAFQYNSGTAASPTWVTVGANYTAPLSLVTYDIKVVFGATASDPQTVELYQNGSLIRSATFTNANFTNWRSTRFSGQGATGIARWSQLMGTEGMSTIGGKVMSAGPTAAGSNSGWTGAVANVNEATPSDTTIISAASSGLRQTFAYGDVTLPANLVVRSVFLANRAKNDGIAPLNVRPVCRSGGTDNVGANIPGITTGFRGLLARFDNDPATSAAWTAAGFNAAEFGVESAA